MQPDTALMIRTPERKAWMWENYPVCGLHVAQIIAILNEMPGKPIQNSRQIHAMAQRVACGCGSLCARVPCTSEDEDTLRALLDERDRLTSERNSAIAEACKQAFESGRWQGVAQGKDETINRLRDALIRLRDCDWVRRPGDRMDAVRDIARVALGEGGEDA